MSTAIDELRHRSEAIRARLTTIDQASAERELDDSEQTEINNLVDELRSIDDEKLPAARREAARDAMRSALERQNEAERSGRAPERVGEERGQVDPDAAAEFRHFLATGELVGGMQPDTEIRTTNTTSVAALVPEEIARRFYDLIDRNAVIGRIAHFESFEYDTNLPRAASLAEDAAPSAPTVESAEASNVEANATDVQIRNSKKGMVTRITDEIIRRSVVSIEQRVMVSHAQAHNRYWEGRFGFGTGTAMPEGMFVDNANTNQISLAGATPTEDELLEALMSALPQEAWGLRSAWLIRDQATWATIAQLEDSSGRKIVRSNRDEGLSGPVQFNIFGVPVYVCPNVGGGAVATDDPVVILATEMSYLINRPGGVSMLRDPYSRARFGEVEFVSHVYQDGRWFFPEYTVQLQATVA